MSWPLGLAPGALLALLLGAVFGGLAHMVAGRRWLQLPLYVGAGMLGCLLAWGLNLHWFGQFPAPGGLPLIEAAIMAWVLLTSVAVWQRA